jgi:hypothetical protein
MNKLNFNDDSVALLARKISTRLRDKLLAQLYLAFADQKLTMRKLADFAGISQPYINRIVQQEKALSKGR